VCSSDLTLSSITLPSAQGGHPVILSVSCVSRSQCVAVGYVQFCYGTRSFCEAGGHGYVATTTDPTRGGTAWRTTQLGSGGPLWDAVSCPSTRLCVAVDGAGNTLTSTNPTAGAGRWTTSNIDGSNSLNGVSCVSRKLCVAVDSAGSVFSSTNPTGGPKNWKHAHLSAHGLSGVSCPATTFCVAVDQSGEAFTSTRPTAGARDWEPTDIDRSETFNSLSGVSCPSILLCVAVDQAGNAIAGLGPSQARMKALLSREITPHGGNATDKKPLRDHGYRLAFRALTAGSARIDWYLRSGSPKIIRGKAKAVLIATGHFAFSSAGTATIRLKVTHMGTSLLTATKLLKLTATGTFTPTGSRPVTAISQFMLRGSGATGESVTQGRRVSTT
jgi:hypothetical protein